MYKQRSKHWERDVAELAVREMARAVMEMDVSDVQVPESLKERADKLFAEERERLASRRRILRKRVTVILVAAIMAVLTACATIPAIRERIYEIVVEYYDKYFSYKSKQLPSQTKSEEVAFKKRTPTYLPDGYELYGDDSSEDMTSVHYWDPMNGFLITYEQFPIGLLQYKGNVETAEIISVKVRGYEGIASVKTINNGCEVTLMWSDDKYDYSLISLSTLDELLRMADSVE